MFSFFLDASAAVDQFEEERPRDLGVFPSAAVLPLPPLSSVRVLVAGYR